MNMEGRHPSFYMKSIRNLLKRIFSRVRSRGLKPRTMHNEGSLRPIGSLEGMHIRGRQIEASDGEHITENVTAVLVRQGEVIGIRVADSEATSLAADVNEDRTVQFQIRGKSRQGEEGIPDVCRILIRRLNADGAQWSEPKDLSGFDARMEMGYDCQSRDGGRLLKIQVTRTEERASVWQTLAKTGEVGAILSVQDAANAIRDATDRKASKTPLAERASLVLALDATETASHTFAPVVRDFVVRHGSWAASLGYQAIWIVGPNVTLTSRVDVANPQLGVA